MTYSSRNFLISTGIGSDARVPRSNLLSSAMMSLQTSTHSSQMNTVGPAMSLRTSFWSLLQNEHRRTSFSPVFFVVMNASRSALVYRRSVRPSLAGVGHPRLRATSCPSGQDVVNDTVILRLRRPHDVVAICVLLDTGHRLARMLCHDFIQHLTHAQDFLGVNVDVARLAAQPGHP